MQSLTQKNLKGDNSGELPSLTVAMMNEPLYLDVLSMLQLCQDVLAEVVHLVSPRKTIDKEFLFIAFDKFLIKISLL